MRLLFCVPTASISGGLKLIFEFANRLAAAGDQVAVFSYADLPAWFGLNVHMLEQKDIAAVDFDVYDFVLVSNAFFVTLMLPYMRRSRLILFCQDYEAYHHAAGSGRTYADFMAPAPAFDDIYRLPVPITVISRPVGELLRQHTGRLAYYLPVAINKDVFTPRPRKPPTPRRRILLVGNYLMPYKGMRDGIAALRLLAEELPVQLVLATQERRGRALFDDLPFPVEIHFCATDQQMPDIIASCDVYCCTSWYEGLGLPALEAFACGVPVVSTRDFGVFDYAEDGENMLLAQPNDPADLYRQLRRLLLDAELAEKLRQGGARTLNNRYDWDASVARLKEILGEIDLLYCGAGSIDPALLRSIIDQLERDGDYTPISVFRRFQELSLELDALLAEMQKQEPPPASAFARLEQLRGEFHAYMGNDQSEYYDAFRARYDLCGAALMLRGNSHFSEYLQRILTRRKQRAAYSPATLTETRY